MCAAHHCEHPFAGGSHFGAYFPENVEIRSDIFGSMRAKVALTIGNRERAGDQNRLKCISYQPFIDSYRQKVLNQAQHRHRIDNFSRTFPSPNRQANI